MTEDHARLIATLKDEPAYKALLLHLDEELAGMLDILREEFSPSKILHQTRLWQVASALISRLHVAPQAIHEMLTEQSQRPFAELDYWEEDPFLRPKRPLPPSSQTA